MNFEQFLQKEVNTFENRMVHHDEKNIKRNHLPANAVNTKDGKTDSHLLKSIDDNKTNKNNNIKSNNIKDNKDTNIQNTNFNEFFLKKDDLVKIIRIPKEGPYYRTCDLYAGYFGEIKEICKDAQSAIVFLHAKTSVTLLKLPIKCLKKM